MKGILAIENSSARVSVAAWRSGEWIFDECFFTERRQTGPLFSMVERALVLLESGARPGESKLDLVLVGTGPGSYNGLRASAALGAGLALGRGIPCAGLSSLLGMGGELRVVAGDARSGQVFFAVVEAGRFLVEPQLVASGELEERLGAVAGLSNAHRSWIGAEAPDARWTTGYPSARELCGIVASAPETVDGAACGELAPAVATPIYLKPPHITRPAR